MLTVVVLGRKDSLEGCARLSPLRMFEVVARAVGVPILGGLATGHPWAGVPDDGVQDAERGEAESALIRAQVEPKQKESVGIFVMSCG